ncbi:MAG: toxin-antitoxin system [Terriglobia bacterium]|jgi:antitoxin FitA
MARIIVRKIEAKVKSRLQCRAKRHHRTMEGEVRDILRNAVRETEAPSGGLGTAIASLFTKIGLDKEIPELRGGEPKPASLNR